MQAASDDVLLTDLCTICHINPIKYTCPRCNVHTCSLPCVKRHKAWAQCSGIRDPAAYRRRTDLTTAASIDQDFNFITSVERSLQKADHLVLDKGIDLTPSGIRGQFHGPNRKFETEVKDRGIHLVKAPRGLSRNKLNKSHWAGQYKCIMWTTEWLCYDGEKRIYNVHELRTVGEAFFTVFGKKAIVRKKRKRSDSETHPARTTQPDAQTPQPEPEHAEQRLVLAEEKSGLPEADRSEQVPTQGQPVIDGAFDTLKTGPHVPGSSELLENLHFYLLRPSTVSKLKCLIPVLPTSTLVDVLHNQTVLEFPTFYVREEAPEDLPEPFITDEKYNELYGMEIPIDINLPTYSPADTCNVDDQLARADIDEKKVLEVLQKDLDG